MTLLNTYKDCAVLASRKFVKSWWLVLLSLAAVAAFVFFSAMIGRIFGGSNFIGGLIIGLLQVWLLSLYYGWLRAAHNGDKIDPKEILHLDSNLFLAIINVGFLFFVAQYVLVALTTPFGLGIVGSLFLFLVVLACNVLPEMIYISGKSDFDTYQESFNFVKENWIEWLVPYFVLLIPVIVASPKSALVLVGSVDPMLPTQIVIWSTISLVSNPNLIVFAIILGIALVSWVMLFRAELFERLLVKKRTNKFWVH